MLTSWIDSKRNVQVLQRVGMTDLGQPDGVLWMDRVEVEVAEDSTGLLTIYVRQLSDDDEPVTVKFVNADDRGERPEHLRKEAAANAEP